MSDTRLILLCDISQFDLLLFFIAISHQQEYKHGSSVSLQLFFVEVVEFILAQGNSEIDISIFRI